MLQKAGQVRLKSILSPPEVLCHFTQLEALKLAGRCFRQFSHEINAMRILKALQPRLAPLLQFRFERGGGSLLRGKDNHSSDAQHAFNRKADDGSFADCRML